MHLIIKFEMTTRIAHVCTLIQQLWGKLGILATTLWHFGYYTTSRCETWTEYRDTEISMCHLYLVCSFLCDVRYGRWVLIYSFEVEQSRVQILQYMREHWVLFGKFLCCGGIKNTTQWGEFVEEIYEWETSTLIRTRLLSFENATLFEHIRKLSAQLCISSIWHSNVC